jgi:glycosyltransferase involved in cell wall biosynthesis
MKYQHLRGRVAIFYPYNTLGVTRVLQDVSCILAESGYQVEIYATHSKTFPSPVFQSPSISVITNQPALFEGLEIRLPEWTIGRGRKVYRRLLSNLFRPFFQRSLRQRHKRIPYVCLIGIDPLGLADAGSFADFLGVPFIYWSLEMLYMDEIAKRADRRLKCKEIEISRSASFTIIQDEWRGHALTRENGLDPAKMILVPNAPRGEARRSPDSFLHRRFGIQPERKIVLCAGQLGWWSMTKELVNAASSWPENYVLVMQSRQQLLTQDISALMSLADPRRVIFSLDPVYSDEYRTMVDSASIGLAFYNPDFAGPPLRHEKNMGLLGLSSGKLSDYLWCGLPVVVNSKVIGPQELINSYNCGICVSEPGQIKEALDKIFEFYDQYVVNACRCFDERLELDKHFRPVIGKLGELNDKQ